jgi:hypothetical protein
VSLQKLWTKESFEKHVPVSWYMQFDGSGFTVLT